jgi:hypothetical protein
MAPRQSLQLRTQEFPGNIDRDVLRRSQRRKQSFGLGTVAGAEVDQCAARPKAGGDLLGEPLEDRALVTRQRVLG